MGQYQSMLHHHRELMNRYGIPMDDYARVKNQQRLNHLEELAQKEMAEELERKITENVLASLTNGNSALANDFAKELQSALKSIKL